MTIVELTARIEPLYLEMKEITLAAGVPESQYNSVVQVDPEMITLDEMQDRLRFLQAVRAEQYQQVLGIWRLLPPEVWDRYELMGETNLREQRLLRAARKNLRYAWRHKYGTSKQQAVGSADQGDPDPERVRSA
jgi:hypothetical protein